ncbi:hypothetical protein [Nostoc sp.]|uniref:hypothetical protein n=1 Tax=Nostoc sp. TaxID=1180 RepID=UPI002FFB1CF5
MLQKLDFSFFILNKVKLFSINFISGIGSYNVSTFIVSRYNRIVGRYNGIVSQYNRIVGRYNGIVSRYNRIVGRYNGIVSQYNRIVGQDTCVYTVGKLLGKTKGSFVCLGFYEFNK